MTSSTTSDEARTGYLVVDQRVTDPQAWAARFHTADRARTAAATVGAGS